MSIGESTDSKAREAIAKHTKSFLAQGGKIEQIPSYMTAHKDAITKADRDSLAQRMFTTRNAERLS